MMRVSKNSNGYGRVALNADGQQKTVFVHRLVADAFIGECPSGHYVDHLNRSRMDNRASNLSYLSEEASNAQGGVVRGHQHRCAKLTDVDVHDIRDASGTHEEIAAAFGISRPQVGKIKGRTRWGWLEDRVVVAAKPQDT